jgi:hypothetical protein
MPEAVVFKRGIQRYLKDEATRERRHRRELSARSGWTRASADREEWITRSKRSRFLIIGEDGLGDEIFYVRFLRTLANHCEGLTWVTNWEEEGVSKNDNAKLLPLLKNSFQDCSNVSFRRFHRDLIPKGEDVIFSKELVKIFGATEDQFIRRR